MRKLVTTLVTLASSVVLAGTASAEATAAQPMPNATAASREAGTNVSETAAKRGHDKLGSFFFRGQLGIGHLATNMELGARAIRTAGLGASATLQAGVTVASQLSTYLQLGVNRVANPTLEASGVTAKTNDLTMTQVWFGPGVTYYFMPVNVYLGGAAGVSSVSFAQPGSAAAAKTELGPALALQVGKEWFIRDGVGLGVCGQAVWASMKDEGVRAGTVTSRALAVALSLTYD